MIWTFFYIRLFWFWRWRMPFFDIAISSWEWHCPSLSPKWRASFLSVDYWLSRRETPHPPDFQVSPGWRTSPVELVNSFPADFLGKPERCPLTPWCLRMQDPLGTVSWVSPRSLTPTRAWQSLGGFLGQYGGFSPEILESFCFVALQRVYYTYTIVPSHILDWMIDMKIFRKHPHFGTFFFDNI